MTTRMEARDEPSSVTGGEQCPRMEQKDRKSLDSWFLTISWSPAITPAWETTVFLSFQSNYLWSPSYSDKFTSWIQMNTRVCNKEFCLQFQSLKTGLVIYCLSALYDYCLLLLIVSWLFAAKIVIRWFFLKNEDIVGWIASPPKFRSTQNLRIWHYLEIGSLKM